MQPFDVNDFKELLEKAKKIHQKLRLINDFEAYDLDAATSLRTKDVQDLIEALKLQHDFIHEAEQAFKLYLSLKARLERFCNKEFVALDSEFNCVEFYVEEFDQ